MPWRWGEGLDPASVSVRTAARRFNFLLVRRGIDELNEELIAEKLHQDFPIAWESTEQWDKEWSNDRLWS